MSALWVYGAGIADYYPAPPPAPVSSGEIEKELARLADAFANLPDDSARREFALRVFGVAR